jgi:hypothetical protein
LSEDAFESIFVNLSGVAAGCDAAGIAGLTFNDLRGTAVTRLALVECTEAEIATITGHALRDAAI